MPSHKPLALPCRDGPTLSLQNNLSYIYNRFSISEFIQPYKLSTSTNRKCLKPDLTSINLLVVEFTLQKSLNLFNRQNEKKMQVPVVCSAEERSNDVRQEKKRKVTYPFLGSGWVLQCPVLKTRIWARFQSSACSSMVSICNVLLCRNLILPKRARQNSCRPAMCKHMHGN